MDFTAIDFETANRRRDSACQLAAVRVRGGKVVDTAMWMIRPEPFYFSPGNIGIHGITPAQVEHEPTFGGHWPDVYRFLCSGENGAVDCLIAHNASFDLGVLLGSLQSHRVTAPELNYTCTRLIARQTWPGRTGYGLKPLSDWLGIRFRHHDALEDSVACAKILLAAAIQRRVSTVEELESTLKISRGSAGPWGTRGPTTLRKARSPRRTVTSRTHVTEQVTSFATVSESPAEYACDEPHTAAIDIQRLIVRAGFIRSLQGECVVFTGVFRHISRPDAERLAASLGGECQTTISRNTTLLVVGEVDERTRQSGQTISTKQQAAEELRDQGQPIRVITEEDFLAMVVALGV